MPARRKHCEPHLPPFPVPITKFSPVPETANTEKGRIKHCDLIYLTFDTDALVTLDNVCNSHQPGRQMITKAAACNWYLYNGTYTFLQSVQSLAAFQTIFLFKFCWYYGEQLPIYLLVPTTRFYAPKMSAYPYLFYYRQMSAANLDMQNLSFLGTHSGVIMYYD